MPQVRAAAEEPGMQGRVRFLGSRSYIPILASLDLFFLPTRADPFPVAVIEAMAAGLPVIASRVGGIPEMLSSPEIGCLVDPLTPGSLRPSHTKDAGAAMPRQIHGRESASEPDRTLRYGHRRRTAEEYRPGSSRARAHKMLSADQRMRLNASRRQWAIVVGMAISLIVLFLALNRLAPGGRPVAGIPGVDPAGDFAAAHSILFDHDLDLSNEYARVPPDTPNRYTGIRKETGLPGNPWPIGYPLLSIPFLAFGSAVDRVAGHAPDGYSHFAVLFYSLTNVVLTGAGLILLFGFLRKSSELFADRYSSEFRGWISVFVAGVTLMGTTVFYYALSPMSHASTFLMASGFFVYGGRPGGAMALASGPLWAAPEGRFPFAAGRN